MGEISYCCKLPWLLTTFSSSWWCQSVRCAGSLPITFCKSIKDTFLTIMGAPLRPKPKRQKRARSSSLVVWGRELTEICCFSSLYCRGSFFDSAGVPQLGSGRSPPAARCSLIAPPPELAHHMAVTLRLRALRAKSGRPKYCTSPSAR